MRIQARAGEPIQAFKLYVLPALNNPNWIENSRDVTDTKLSSREWAGLVMHAIALEDLTGDHMLVAAEDTGGDGAITRMNGGVGEAVLVEQTLATHLKHNDLLTAVEERVTAKSSQGENYAANKHLVVWCNITGEMDEEKLAKVVSKGRFNIVDIIGFHEKDKAYFCYIFDRDNDKKPIHRCSISERKLVEAAAESDDAKRVSSQ